MLKEAVLSTNFQGKSHVDLLLKVVYVTMTQNCHCIYKM